MGAQLEKLRNLVDDIKDKVESICRMKCSECNIDEKELLPPNVANRDGGDEDEDEDTSLNDEKSDNTDDLSTDDIGESSLDEKREGDKSNGSSGLSQSEIGSAEDASDDDRKEMEKFLNRRTEGDFADDEDQEEEIEIDDNDDVLYGQYKKSSSSGKPFDDNGITVSYKYAKTGVDPKLRTKIGRGDDVDDDDVEKGSVASGLSRVAGKRLQRHLLKRGYKAFATKTASKAAGKAATKATTKAAAKGAGKIAAKSLAKKLPLGLGLIPATYYAIERAKEGDMGGAGLEMASGAAAAVPLVGTLASLGIDGYLANRDVERATGKGIIGNGLDLAGNYILRRAMGESYCKYNTLYDRARTVFESESGIDESVDGYCFDDYVTESKIDNGILTDTEISESSVFYGYKSIEESRSSVDAELETLFKKLSPDGKVSIDDLMPDSSDSLDIQRTKARIREILNGGGGGGRSGRPMSPELNMKEYKKAVERATGPGGQKSASQLWHMGLDEIGNGVEDALEKHFIPQSVSKKLNLPKNLGRLAGAGVGGLLFGPMGAIAGTALANWIANNHEKYKAKQLADYRGLSEKDVVPERSGYAGGLVGAGIGSLLGGPVGGIIGGGLGHLLDRKREGEIVGNGK